MVSPAAPISKLEKQYIQSSLLSSPPLRDDGRGLCDYRQLRLETAVAPLANGSARAAIGDAAERTEVLATVKLEVEDIIAGQGGESIVCTVICTPSAYPGLSPTLLDELSADLTSVLHTTLAHASIAPGVGLMIVPGRRRWVCYLDAMVLSDAGNVGDVMWAAARAALCDARVPRTRPLDYRAPNEAQTEGGLDIMMPERSKGQAGASAIAEFELVDNWDDGDPLGEWDVWPVGVTLNLVPPIYYLDATSAEEAATPLKLILVFSFRGEQAAMQGIRLVGTGELKLSTIQTLIKAGEKHARHLYLAQNKKLKEEEARQGRKATGR